ncbi:MAG: LLM class flavin-dependent oxidoreductase [Chloroflexi bacterium]|nr:LLM class flavin-dependent oxidoreductase [Chloroflexota bacterium]
MLIGAVVRLGPVPEGAQPPPYADIRHMAQRMEDAGLDSIWVYDHLLYRWPGRPTDGIWESWTVLAALAQATQRVQLGTLVVCTPFRNPAVLAKMASTLDEVSNGRLTLGLGAGWHQPEFDAFGVPFDHRASRFQEALEIICPLLRTGRVDFQGAYYTARDCELIPRGPRPNGLPVMLAGSGPRMLRLAARYADSWNTAWHTEPASAIPRIESIRAACASEGRAPETLQITASVGLGYADLGPVTARAGLTGTPEHVAEALRGYAELGVAHVMIEFSPYTEAALDRLASALHLFR